MDILVQTYITFAINCLRVSKNTAEFVLCLPSTPGQALPLHVVRVLREAMLEKTSFSFVSRWQLAGASGLGMGPCVCLPSRHCGPMWLRPGQPLSVLPLSLRSCVQSPRVKEAMFSSIPTGSPAFLLLVCSTLRILMRRV